MEKHFRAPIGHKTRWAVGITLAGVVAGGAFAAATTTGSNASAASPANSASTTELNALLSASNASNASNASSTTPTANRVGPLRRLRRLGGEYGSFTVTTKGGTRTLAFERGTIQSVSSTDVVIRAANGTTMTWLLVSDTVVRDHGKASTNALAPGQLVFAGGPVASGAKDARLIVVRTPRPAGTPAPSSTPGTSVS